MKTVTTETQDRATTLIADGEASKRTLLSGIRRFIKIPNLLEKSLTFGGDTRLVPVLR